MIDNVLEAHGSSLLAAMSLLGLGANATDYVSPLVQNALQPISGLEQGYWVRSSARILIFRYWMGEREWELASG